MQRMIRRLRLEETEISIREIFSKDSLYITDPERKQIVEAVRASLGRTPAPDGIVIIHGTDTLCVTGELLHKEIVEGGPRDSPRKTAAHPERGGCAIVLTGAIRPFEMKRSDALQNLTEALFAASVLTPGVYVVAHGRALRFPGVTKDRGTQTFVSV